MVAASLVNPDNNAVIPLMPALVTRDDGSAKNDCEANAVKRLLPHVRREHSHLALTVLMDALHGKAPQVRMLRKRGMNVIIGAKDQGHKTVYSQLADGGRSRVIEREDGRTLTVCWRNGFRLHASTPDIMVNALDHCEQYVPDPETAGLQPYPFLRARQEMAGLCPAGDHEDGLCDGQDRGVVLLGIPNGTGGSRIKDDTVEANAVPVRCP